MPPDELELMEDDANFDYTAEYDTAPSRPAKKKRPSLMTAVRGSTAKTESRTRLPEHAIASPSAGTSASSDTLSSPSTLLNNPDQPAASATRQDAAGPIPPRPVHAANDLRRSTLGPDRWWTFTLPSKYLDRVQDYVRNQENGTAASQNEKGKEREREGRDDPDGQPGDDREPDTSRGKDETLKRRRGEGSVDLEKQEYHRSMTMSIPRLAPPNVFSLNQTDVSNSVAIDLALAERTLRHRHLGGHLLGHRFIVTMTPERLRTRSRSHKQTLKPNLRRLDLRCSS